MRAPNRELVNHKQPLKASRPTRRADLLAYLFGFFVLLASPAFALPDWTVSITDPGQDGLPAGSTLVYDLAINNASLADDAPATTITFNVAAGTSMTSGGGLLGCVGLDVVGPTTVTCNVPAIPTETTLKVNR